VIYDLLESQDDNCANFQDDNCANFLAPSPGRLVYVLEGGYDVDPTTAGLAGAVGAVTAALIHE
jgi:hypothetical protein